MKVYNNLNTVVEYGLTFDTFKTKAENIYKDNYIYLEEIGYDGEGYFDLSINKLYWRLSPGKEYTVFDCVLNEDLEIPRNSTNSTIKIVSYTSLEIDNFLFLSEDVSNGFDENGNIITLLTEHTTLEVVTYKKMCSDIKQKRPTDESQDWEDTEEFKETLKKQNALKLSEELNSDIYTVEDIIKELLNPGLDPRDELEAPILKSDVLHIEDLKVGMELQGTVRNVASFGAFVDIGLHDDGLVHISKMSKSFVKNPNDIVHVGDIVTCYVADIDLTKQKVQLSLIKEL